MTDRNSTSDGEQERLNQVGERIDRARDQAREALADPEQKFVESDEGDQLNDQTIAPPG